ncbi:hypothetical protein ACXZ1K_11395 [Pedobacter sp. PWIIR3]
MRKLDNIFYVIFILLLMSCHKSLDDRKIETLVKSKNIEDLIIGVFEAGERGDKRFISLLLLNADNPSASLNIRFTGFTVYQQKMSALKKILKVSPPVPIQRSPDSLVIKFHKNYVKNHHFSK